MDHLSQYLKAIMSDVEFSVLEALGARRALTAATSLNGLVAVKLNRIRKALNDKLEPSIAAIDVMRFNAALKDGEAIKAIPGASFADTLTPAFEIDPAKVDVLNLELAAIYTETVSIKAPRLTALDAGWIRLSENASEDEARRFGIALDYFTDSDLAA